MPKSRSYLEGPSVALTLSQTAELELLLKGLLNDDRRYLDRSELDAVSDLKNCPSSLGAYPVSLAVPSSQVAEWRTGERVVLRDPEAAPVAVLDVEKRWKDASIDLPLDFTANDSELVSGPLTLIELPGRHVYEELRVAERPPADGSEASLAYFTNGILHPREMDALRQHVGDARLELFALGGWQYVESLESLRIRCLSSALQHWKGPSKLHLVPWPRHFSRDRSAAIWMRIARRLGCRQIAWRGVDEAPAADTENPAAVIVSPEALASGIEIPASLSPALEQCRADLSGGRRIDYAFAGVRAELERRYRKKADAGLTILLTGLSGAGKSTLARSLATYLSLHDARPLTLLDGDVVRRHLSSELGFSKEHRDLNVLRIGFVAAEITKNGGIAVCAPIAPYADTRGQVRRLIERQGGFVEVHVATSLELCESRDRKGYYERARRGEIRQFTGIDDPYEVPDSPEVRLDTSDRTPEESLHELVGALKSLGVIDPAE